MSRKLTGEEIAKLRRTEQGSFGRLTGTSRQQYDLNMLCWRMAYEHNDCRCWACTYVERQKGGAEYRQQEAESLVEAARERDL